MTPLTQSPPTNGDIALQLGLMGQQLEHIQDGQTELKTSFEKVCETNDERLKSLETGQAVLASRYANHTAHPTGGRVAELEIWRAGVDARMVAHTSQHKTQARRGVIADAFAYVGVLVAAFIGFNNR